MISCKKYIAVAIAFSCFYHVVASSDDIKRNNQNLTSLLLSLIESHDKVRSAEAQLNASRQRVKVAWRKWYPELDITIARGNHKNYRSDNDVDFKQVRGRVSQLLWDFGVSNSEIKKAQIRMQIDELTLQQVRQTLLLNGISAYINLVRAREVLNYAITSEENIRRQTGLEKIRVAQGSGYSTDVLQAKAQLAGAISRRIRSEGIVARTENSFLEVFGTLSENMQPAQTLLEKGFLGTKIASIENLMGVSSLIFDLRELPTDLEDALRLSGNNTVIRKAILERNIARQTRQATKAKNLYPEIVFSIERSFDENLRGNIGIKNELISQVELKMPFNLGLAGIHRIRTQTLEVTRRNFDMADQRRNIEKQVRDRWQNLQTSKEQVTFLNQQADISAAFLALARKERKLGQRSLIDLLGSETSLVNARSDSASAQADTLIAMIALLEIMGKLKLANMK